VPLSVLQPQEGQKMSEEHQEIEDGDDGDDRNDAPIAEPSDLVAAKEKAAGEALGQGRTA